jgi:hypothetical protein
MMPASSEVVITAPFGALVVAHELQGFPSAEDAGACDRASLGDGLGPDIHHVDTAVLIKVCEFTHGQIPR